MRIEVEHLDKTSLCKFTDRRHKKKPLEVIVVVIQVIVSRKGHLSTSSGGEQAPSLLPLLPAGRVAASYRLIPLSEFRTAAGSD